VGPSSRPPGRRRRNRAAHVPTPQGRGRDGPAPARRRRDHTGLRPHPASDWPAGSDGVGPRRAGPSQPPDAPAASRLEAARRRPHPALPLWPEDQSPRSPTSPDAPPPPRMRRAATTSGWRAPPAQSRSFLTRSGRDPLSRTGRAGVTAPPSVRVGADDLTAVAGPEAPPSVAGDGALDEL